MIAWAWLLLTGVWVGAFGASCLMLNRAEYVAAPLWMLVSVVALLGTQRHS